MDACLTTSLARAFSPLFLYAALAQSEPLSLDTNSAVNFELEIHLMWLYLPF